MVGSGVGEEEEEKDVLTRKWGREGALEWSG